jgi:imidazolonepropionase-like amidohydrolase
MPARVVRAATLDAAELLGRRDRIGGSKAGRIAAVIAVRGDPPADAAALGRVTFAMQWGRVVRPDPATAAAVAPAARRPGRTRRPGAPSGVRR